MTDPNDAGGGRKVLRSLSHWGAFRARIEDGRLVDVLPFEHDPAPSDLISAWPEMLRSPLRVRRPAIRRGWLDGDGGAGRGSDGYREVPWDEALDLAAGEIGRVRERHGNAALFAGSYGWSSAGRLHHARTLVRRFFGAIGGFTDQVTNYSYGAAMAFLPRILGVPDPIGDGAMTAQTLRDHCDVMLAFGGLPQRNWEVVSGGFGRHAYPGFMAALRERVRLVAVTPFRGDVPADHPCEWLAPRPNTDAALILALSHTILSAGLHDEAFLGSHCHGFETYRAYLLGESDGVRKTAEWAAPITGLDAGEIRQLALSLPGRRVLLTANWSLQRARHGEQPYWAIVALAAMLGQIGLPGGGFVFGYGSSNSMGSPRFETPLFGLPVGPNPVGIAIPVARVADLLLRPGDTVRFDGRDIVYPDIRLVYWAGGNPFHHHQDLNRLREAFRRPKTVIVNEGFWTATARHADIVFPATVAAEREDIGGSSRDPFILAMHKLAEPAGQARDDFAIFADLAERLGDREAFTGGRTEREWLHHAWRQIARRLEARGMAPPSFEAFWEKGFFEVDRPKGDDRVPFAAFRADPHANRLATATGRIEIGSPAIAEFAPAGQPNHPAWLDPEEWLGSALARTYPIHLLTPQPARRLHGQMDWSAVSAQQKTDGRERVTMHPEDARVRGIGEGDLVRLFNDRGSCLAVAALTEDLRPGVALLPTGATFDPDGRDDRNSNPNVLTRDIGTSELGQGCSAQSCLVEIEPLRGPAPPLRIHEPPPIVGLGQSEAGRKRMTIAFDHLILLVHDLDAAARDFREMGFVVTERQDGVEGAMANRFICFADGSYLLLSAFREPAAAASHRLAPLLEVGEGWADYSYLVGDVAGAAERLRREGLPVRGPLRVANTLASGEAWSLDLLLAGIGAGGEEALPFLVEDREGRAHRIPRADRHPNGARGIAGVRLRVSSAAPALQALAAMLGGEPQPVEAGETGTPRYRIGDTWLEIVEDAATPPGRGRLVEAVLTSGQGERRVLPPALLHGAALRLG